HLRARHQRLARDHHRGRGLLHARLRPGRLQVPRRRPGDPRHQGPHADGRGPHRALPPLHRGHPRRVQVRTPPASAPGHAHRLREMTPQPRGLRPREPPALSVESSSGGDRPCSSFVETYGSYAPRMPEPEGRQAMSLGPVEYVILGFPGNQFTGQIVPELAKLIDSGLVRIIDLTFIMKDAAGGVEVVEYDAVEELAAFAGLDAEVGGILTEE